MTKQAKSHSFYNQGLEVLMEKLLWGRVLVESCQSVKGQGDEENLGSFLLGHLKRKHFPL